MEEIKFYVVDYYDIDILNIEKIFVRRKRYFPNKKEADYFFSIFDEIYAPRLYEIIIIPKYKEEFLIEKKGFYYDKDQSSILK